MTAEFSPGVRVIEEPSDVRTIVGVATSITAFVGRTSRGPVLEPTLVHSFSEFRDIFGGLWLKSPLSYAVQQYFLNGGRDALIVRVYKRLDPDQDGCVVLGQTEVVAPAPPEQPPAKLDDPAKAPDNPAGNSADESTKRRRAGALAGAGRAFKAKEPGSWGKNLRVSITQGTSEANIVRFTVEVSLRAGTELVQQEVFRNVTAHEADPHYLPEVIRTSKLVVLESGADAKSLLVNGANFSADPKVVADPKLDPDGFPPEDEEARAGVNALERADLFNLLCIPPFSFVPDKGPTKTTWDEAAKFCTGRRAVLIVDPPASWRDHSAAKAGFNKDVPLVDNAVVYYPRILAEDPLSAQRIEDFVPCGAAAGVIARTDALRGIWKAPAGIGPESTLLGVRGLTQQLTDDQCGGLNQIGVNCLRSFASSGAVVWGARTCRGGDELADQWKYLPVRRLAYFIEESLVRGLKWAVFEPNDERLWAQLRLNVGAFIHDLFRQGAFQGSSPRDAYLVKCDGETTRQSDINRGVVNIVVGFAPLKPAEFVVLRLQQLAGQVQS